MALRGKGEGADTASVRAGAPLGVGCEVEVLPRRCPSSWMISTPQERQPRPGSMKAVNWPEPVSPTLDKVPVISISMESDDDKDDSATAPSSEFYDFVGFREAISPVLHRAWRASNITCQDHRLTMTQLNRQALARFIARPELAGDLMISNVAVIPQVVNDKSNADRSHPLSERERTEHATFRLTLFNCSNNTLEVSHGEFIPETVDVREYDKVETRPLQTLDHKGHVQVRLDDVQPGRSIPLTLNSTIAPLAATNVVVWFRSSGKPSLTTIRGQLKLGEGNAVALTEPVTIIMHGDSP